MLILELRTEHLSPPPLIKIFSPWSLFRGLRASRFKVGPLMCIDTLNGLVVVGFNR